MIVSSGERTFKREFLVIGYMLDETGSVRESVILKNSLDEVSEVNVRDFGAYKIVKVYREGVTPELIYLDGVPDKIVSGQCWVPKDKTLVDPFDYVARGTYAADENPNIIWEVQCVINNEVTLNLIQQDTHAESGFKNNKNTGKVLKLTKRELVENYRLHSFGFHLSNDFFKYIQNETYVAPENKDKIYMMGRGGKGQYVQIDDMVGPPKKSNQVNLDSLF